jgi:two-component system NtrC family sensor kinase
VHGWPFRDGKDAGPRGGSGSRSSYPELERRIVLVTLLCSVLPLLLLGWGINTHYTRLTGSRVSQGFREQVEHHKKTIDLFLRERSSCIQLVAQTHSCDQLCRDGSLAGILDKLNSQYGGSFTDLGVIGDTGEHLAYVGPYDLMDRNYARTFWFARVMEQGIHVSDMFMGFRQEPHFIIAVLRNEEGRRWILRATIDTEIFRSLVEDVKLGRTGEVALLNAEGIFQTSPRTGGEIMGPAPYSVPGPHEGIRTRVLEPADAPRELVAHAWLESVPWLLVVKQEHAEAFGAVRRSSIATLSVLHLSVLAIILVSFLTARRMIRIIRARDEEMERLNRQLMHAGKLAAIGELAAGVAHEINNPLAIMSSAREVLLDQAKRTPSIDCDFEEQLERASAQIATQIRRCKGITQNLLRFARRTTSRTEVVDLNAFLLEVIHLVENEARSVGVEFTTDLDGKLSPIESDPSHLQQIFLNLMKNAIDAHEGKTKGRVHVVTGMDEDGAVVRASIEDSGSGIRPEHMERLFEPFFTTKPVGKGTGLGLSICYSLIESLGGEITVTSEPGSGAVFTVELPAVPPDRPGEITRTDQQEVHDALLEGPAR